VRTIILATVMLLPACGSMNTPKGGQATNWPIVYQQNFLDADSLTDFAFTDASRWEFHHKENEHGLKLLGGSNYKPPHRSPTSIALIKDLEVRNFNLEVELKQTGRNYGHRDMCLFFGFQSPAQYYYTHLATSPDANAHNIFRVQDSPRTNIAEIAERGIDWGDDIWHTVRIERRAQTGLIRVFFDDATQPVLTATDTNFAWGRVGFGSFDDSGIVANIILRAPVSRKTTNARNPFAN
jgi:hypothetical protein